MKRFALLFTLTVIAITTFADIKESIEGNGNVKEENREITNFDQVYVSDKIDLYLTQGNAETLTLKADENFLQHIKTEVKNGTLKIYSKKKFKEFKKLEAHLTFKQLQAIDGSDGADVIGKTLIKAEEMDIDMSSGSDLKIKLESTTAYFNMSSGADAMVKFFGKELTIDASSGSDLDLNADELEEIRLSISSGSDVILSGSAQKMRVNASSGSDIEAGKFVVVDARLNLSSGSDARVNVIGELNVNASSSADVHYKKGVEDIRINSSGLSSVRAY